MHLPVSVLMSVYNAESYLCEAIDSILQQSFKEFEFIIIDDASTDNSCAIVKQYQDKRIKLIENEHNLGLTRSLNKGISFARGKYIARMDADDVSNPTRLDRQLAYMEAHPKVGVCGTWVRYRDIMGRTKTWKYETKDEDIKIHLLYRNRIAHPSVMIRRSVLLENHLVYNEEFLTTQDYELWVRLSNFCQLANLSHTLLSYRRQETSISVNKRRLQTKNTHKVRLQQLYNLRISPSLSEFITHIKIINDWNVTDYHDLKKRSEWLEKLWNANEIQKAYTQYKFKNFLEKEWRKSVLTLRQLDINVYLICLTCQFPLPYRGIRQHAVFFLRCITGSLI